MSLTVTCGSSKQHVEKTKGGSLLFGAKWLASTSNQNIVVPYLIKQKKTNKQGKKEAFMWDGEKYEFQKIMESGC